MLLPHAMALLALASFAYGTGPILVPTTSGPVRGVATDKGRYWKGIPYATPPVGNMRWQNPMPASIWTQPKDTSAFGPACPQVSYCRVMHGKKGGREDRFSSDSFYSRNPYRITLQRAAYP